MDQKDLGLTRYDGGREYLRAIRSLNLEPEALFWAYDNSIDQFVLVLVTSLFDYAGPLAVSQLLFDAYNAAATPKEIDPFIIRLHSPNQAIYREAQVYISTRYDQADLEGSELERATIAGTVTPAIVASFSLGDLASFGTWVYKSTPAARRGNAGTVERLWKRFERSVHSVAA